MILVKYIINPIKYVTFHKLKGLLVYPSSPSLSSSSTVPFRGYHGGIHLALSLASYLCHANHLSRLTTSMDLPCGLPLFFLPGSSIFKTFQKLKILCSHCHCKLVTMTMTAFSMILD